MRFHLLLLIDFGRPRGPRVAEPGTGHVGSNSARGPDSLRPFAKCLPAKLPAQTGTSR